MNCYSCDRPAVNACKRCTRTYCDDHGNATYCAECLQPASAMPSFNLYRGALLVMLIGTAIAIFLLLRPPGGTSGAPTLTVGRVTPTVTVEGGAEPTRPPSTPADGATDTPATEAAGTESAGTPAPEATSEPVAFREYIVQDGDTLYGIAELTMGPDDDLTAYVEAIANLNNWTVDTAELIPGETIVLPPLP